MPATHTEIEDDCAVRRPSALSRLIKAVEALPAPEAPERITGALYARELDQIAKAFPRIDALALNEARNLTYGGERVARLRITAPPKDFIGRGGQHVEVNAKVLRDVIAVGLKAMGKEIVSC